MRLVSVICLLGLFACTKREEAPGQRTAAAAQPGASTVPMSSSASPSASPSGPPSAPWPNARSPAAVGLAAKSAEECTKLCNGEWSRHGIKQQLYCLCRTADAGKDCEDGADCEGQCLLRDVRTRLVEQGPPARGFFVGKCSEFVTVLGCVSRIAHGAKVAGPVGLDDPPPTLCAD